MGIEGVSMTENQGYIRLKNRFRLRGWKKLPYALEDKETGRIWMLTSDGWAEITGSGDRVDILRCDFEPGTFYELPVDGLFPAE